MRKGQFMEKYLILLTLGLILPFSFLNSQVPEMRDNQTSLVTLTKDFSAEELMSLKRISDPQISPDGRYILMAIGTPSIVDNKMTTEIYVASIDGSSINKIDADNSVGFNARWSPDGRKIAFLSRRDGSVQIYQMDFPSGIPELVNKLPNDVANLAWSPDGTKLSFTMDVKIDQTIADKYPNYPKANMKIYESFPVRHWDEWLDENWSHLFVIPSTVGEPKDLMPKERFDTPLKPFDGSEDIAWSPDGKEMAYTCKKVKNFAESTNSDIYLVNVETGETKDITYGMMGFDKYPAYSPDGNWLAFTSQERAGFESDRIRLMLYNRKTGEIKELAKSLDQWVEEYVWAPDSKSIYCTATTFGTVQIYRINISDGKWTVLTKGEYQYGHGLGISKDGSTLVAGRQDFTHPMELYSINASSGEAKQITKLNDFNLQVLRKIKVESRQITSTDGKKVQCWILFPPEFDAKKKYPMITYCQGGPQSMIAPHFHYRWNLYLMASKGYIVVAPNRRGVPGFGQLWNDAISKDWGGQPMQDILAATDEMCKEPYVNKNGLCAVGASAGGYATFWLAGNHNKRFKAFASHCGVFDFTSMYGSTEELWFPNWEYGGPYWKKENKEQYDKFSPHQYAQNWDTPIFISTGGNDFRVPYTQSLEAFTVAQVKNIPSKLVFLPEETHFISHPQEFIVWSNEFFGFLDKYCKK
jgi:dipeptidyl aminopeptidase/acylaminoacyl peptidase